MEELVALSDIAIGNEEDAEKVFGISAPAVDITKGFIDPNEYESVCLEMKKRFPNLQLLGFTLRSSVSATHNRWSGIVWKDHETFVGPTYDITFIVDRVGAGDSFNAGLIYGLSTYSDDYQKALDFALAASALKHSIMGDFNLASVNEVEKIMEGDLSGRVIR
jgi:2-dehydro-3-deoxygluconokinase